MASRLINLIVRFKWYFVVILLTLPTISSLLRPGFFPMHDDLQAMRVYQMELCLKDLQIPCRWVPDMGYQYGYPQFEYYGPLPYYVMTASRFLGLPLFASVKLGFILPLIIGNLAMFLLASSVFGNWGGLLSALAYGYAPFRASDTYTRGAMGETWAFIFLPLILYFLLRLFKSANTKTAALLALSLAGLFVTHNISTLIFMPIVAIIALVLVLFSKQKKNFIKFGLLSLLLAVLAAGFFFLPVIFEKGYAHTESLISGYFNYLAHFVTLKQLFFTSFWGYGSSEIGPSDDLSFFLGAIQILLFLASLFLALKTLLQKKLKLSSLIVILSLIFLLVSLFMTHEKSTFIWKFIPVLSYLQFPWRFLITANFFISLGAGYLLIHSPRPLIPTVIFFLLLFIFNFSFFRPRQWYNLTVWEKFSGVSWDRQLTISIFDYLPIYASHPPADPAPHYPTATGKVSYLDYVHQSASFSFTTKSDSDTILTLPQSDFPGWEVKLDGKIIAHRHDNDLGLITFDLPRGNHRVEAKLFDTPLRLIGDLSSLIFVPLALYLCLRKTS